MVRRVAAFAKATAAKGDPAYKFSFYCSGWPHSDECGYKPANFNIRNSAVPLPP
jgi:hypothetical protein